MECTPTSAFRDVMSENLSALVGRAQGKETSEAGSTSKNVRAPDP